jgi:hypothetical protein
MQPGWLFSREGIEVLPTEVICPRPALEVDFQVTCLSPSLCCLSHCTVQLKELQRKWTQDGVKENSAGAPSRPPVKAVRVGSAHRT